MEGRLIPNVKFSTKLQKFLLLLRTLKIYLTLTLVRKLPTNQNQFVTIKLFAVSTSVQCDINIIQQSYDNKIE